ncbi:MAG: LTA synthase family protein [Oscillospiraceae bacterium]
MNHKKTLTNRMALLLTLPLTGFITLLVLWMHPVSLRAMLGGMLRQPLLLLLNGLPIFLLLLAFSFLLKNVFYSAAGVTFVTAALSIVNRVKLQIRDDPFTPRDFGLLQEAADAAKSYDLHLPWLLIGCVCGFTLLFLFLGWQFQAAPRPDRRKGHWLPRLVGFVAPLALLVLSVLTVYRSDKLYASFSVSNPYNLTVVCNELGFPYYFSHHFTTYQVVKPDGFDKQQAAAWDRGDGTDSPTGGKPVHVIFVMDEAFCDLTAQPVFTYTAETDPLTTFHALQKSENAQWGQIVVPGFAGGTANTEFDVMTGMQTGALNTTSAFRSFNRNLDSVIRVFGQEGYRTTFMHPGDPWFYNRENVYAYLGAEDILFADDFANSVSKGRWVTDDTVAQNILTHFNDAVAADELLFDFAVTIQNHMSYTADKYGDGYDFPPVQTDVPLSQEASTLLSVYIEGLRDADAMLKTLTDAFSASSEPVLLVFFGDHLPYLGDDRLCYRELGLPAANDAADNFTSYETPYLLWHNDAAQDAVNLSGLEQGASISAGFLGGAVLEATGRGDATPWFSFLNDLRRQIPILQNGFYRLPDGTVTADLPAAEAAQLSQYRDWSYYKLKYKKVD